MMFRVRHDTTDKPEMVSKEDLAKIEKGLAGNPEFGNPRKGLYYVIPSLIMDSEELEPLAKLLYGLLSGFADDVGMCFPSDKYLSQRLKISLRQVQDLLAQLEGLGLLTRETYMCQFNPFKKRRRMYIKTEFKKVLRNAQACESESAQACESGLHGRASIVSKANLVSEETPPPLVPRKQERDPEPPTKEEEEEISKRLKERKEKTFLSKVGHDSSWKKRALFELRQENAQRNALEAEKIQNIKKTSKDMMESKERRERHFKEAQEWFGKTYKGWLVSDGGLCVWFSKEGKSGNVRYDITDEEWRKLLKWEIPDSPI